MPGQILANGELIEGAVMMRVLAAILAVGLVTSLQAEPMDSKTARSQLFGPNGRSVEVFPTDFLGDAESEALEGYAAQFQYYAAFAVSPGDPADTGSAVGLANFHSETSARNAALAACNERRTTGRACIIVAVTRPKRWEERPLQLSSEATEAFRKEFRKLRRPRAMAVSPATGAWAVARGDGARAQAQCNERFEGAGEPDCQVVIADP
ncbi:MAG: hypothetical protein AAFV38_15245 [Pseudomonadota bacterium]